MPRKPLDLTGQRFGRWLVLGPAENIGKYRAWHCQCDCGNRKIIRGNSLIKGLSRSCGCFRKEKRPFGEKEYKEIYGKRKERPSFLGYAGISFKPEEMNPFYARITFEGKHIFLGMHSNLEKAVSARREAELDKFGYIKEYDKGDSVGWWTILQEIPKSRLVKCECRCGTVKRINIDDAIYGRRPSCGCLEKVIYPQDNIKRDLAKQKFGLLTALTPTEERDSDGNVIWRCKCKCGNYRNVSSHSLLKGNTKSCGCLVSKNFDDYRREKKKQSKKYGTTIDRLGMKTQKNSKTGVRGVSIHKRRGKFVGYQANIVINGKQKYLGTFSTVEEAAEARKAAEEKYFKPILDRYKKSAKDKPPTAE